MDESTKLRGGGDESSYSLPVAGTMMSVGALSE